MNKNSQALSDLAFEALDDLKAENITRIDLDGVSSMCDGMLIASGNSSQHVKSIAEHVRVSAKEAGFQVFGVEGADKGEWALIDLGDIVVHVMQPEIREYYELEKLLLVDAKQPPKTAEK